MGDRRLAPSKRCLEIAGADLALRRDDREQAYPNGIGQGPEHSRELVGFGLAEGTLDQRGAAEPFGVLEGDSVGLVDSLSPRHVPIIT